MDKINYLVRQIQGDYVILEDKNGNFNKVAMLLLPVEIQEGDQVIYDFPDYNIVK